VRLAVYRATLGEALGRKIVLLGWIASALLVGLFGLGLAFLFDKVSQDESLTTLAQRVLVGGILTILGLYVGSFLSAFLAMMLAAGSVSSEIDSGVLQAVVVRPHPRWRWYLERWFGLVTMSVVYVVVITLAILLVARVVAAYEPSSVFGLLAILALQVTLLVTRGHAAQLPPLECRHRGRAVPLLRRSPGWAASSAGSAASRRSPSEENVVVFRLPRRSHHR